MRPALLLTGGTLLDLDPPRIRKEDLVLSEGVIGRPSAPIPTTSTIDCSGCLIIPGLAVAHTHLYSSLARGMPSAGPPPTGFREILERVWWRLDVALDADSLRRSAEIAALEALKCGVTTLIDHHESPRFIEGSLEVIGEATRAIGIRAALSYGATDRHGPDGAQAGLRESERFVLRTEASPSPLLRGMLGLHAPFTCSEETLRAVADAARRNEAWLHFHAAEGPDDQADAKARFAEPLIPALDRLGLIGERTLLAHGVDLSSAEVERLAERKCWVAHQARSNMNNGVGYAGQLGPIGTHLALGTDGIDNDALAELRAAFFRAREASGPSRWPDPLAMLSGAHRLASAVFETRLGSLEPGAAADVVVLAYDPPTAFDAATAGSHFLFGIGARHVRDVFVDGRPVVRNRKLITADEAEIAAKARTAAAALWSRMGA